jgi:hypothetical protein
MSLWVEDCAVRYLCLLANGIPGCEHEPSKRGLARGESSTTGGVGLSSSSVVMREPAVWLHWLRSRVASCSAVDLLFATLKRFVVACEVDLHRRDDFGGHYTNQPCCGGLIMAVMDS